MLVSSLGRVSRADSPVPVPISSASAFHVELLSCVCIYACIDNLIHCRMIASRMLFRYKSRVRRIAASRTPTAALIIMNPSDFQSSTGIYIFDGLSSLRSCSFDRKPRRRLNAAASRALYPLCCSDLWLSRFRSIPSISSWVLVRWLELSEEVGAFIS